MTPTNEQLQELLELEKKIENTLWDEKCCYGAIRHVRRNVDASSYCFDEDGHYDGKHKIFNRDDGIFIAKSRNLLKPLIEEVLRLREGLELIVAGRIPCERYLCEGDCPKDFAKKLLEDGK